MQENKNGCFFLTQYAAHKDKRNLASINFWPKSDIPLVLQIVNLLSRPAFVILTYYLVGFQLGT